MSHHPLASKRDVAVLGSHRAAFEEGIEQLKGLRRDSGGVRRSKSGRESSTCFMKLDSKGTFGPMRQLNCTHVGSLVDWVLAVPLSIDRNHIILLGRIRFNFLKLCQQGVVVTDTPMVHCLHHAHIHTVDHRNESCQSVFQLTSGRLIPDH